MKKHLNADDQPVLELKNVVITITPPGTVNFSFTYKEQRYKLTPETNIFLFKQYLRFFWMLESGGQRMKDDEIEETIDKFARTSDKPELYPYPLKKQFPLHEVAKAEKARAQFPALIKQYEAIQNDSDAVAKWLKKLAPGQRAAMQDYIQYAQRAAQEAAQELQRSLAILSINLTTLNNALMA